jgi:hypothetical protein
MKAILLLWQRFSAWRRDRLLEWTPHCCLRIVTTIDGERLDGMLMGRRINGEWRYRRMTDKEKQEYESVWAI